jgi:hypothetical protein
MNGKNDFSGLFSAIDEDIPLKSDVWLFVG